MNTVVIIQKGADIYGVFSTSKAANDHFNKFIGDITSETMKHLAMTYQCYNVDSDRYYFRQMKVSKSYK